MFEELRCYVRRVSGDGRKTDGVLLTKQLLDDDSTCKGEVKDTINLVSEPKNPRKVEAPLTAAEFDRFRSFSSTSFINYIASHPCSQTPET
jgi:hypothetical protein